MRKKVVFGLLISIVLVVLSMTGLIIFDKSNDIAFNHEMLNLNNSKVFQSFEDLKTIKRNIPETYQSENIATKYPTYGQKLTDISQEEKQLILQETNMLFTSQTTYDEIDENGNYLLNNIPTGKKLYKHIASQNMYNGSIDDNQEALVRKINVNPTIRRNYLTGLYAAPGELIKVNILQEDLDKIGSLTVYIGQVTHRNFINTIPINKDYTRLPTIVNSFKITKPTSYVGNVLGGPIYIYPEKHNGFSVTISGAIEYPCYIHGYTTRNDFSRMLNSSAPYFDFEVFDKGIRHSGPKSTLNLDYDNLLKVGDLWEKICRTSARVPVNSSVECGVGYIYDTYVLAGEAVALVGGRVAVNAPIYWFNNAINYNSMVQNGFWGTIHEYNHHFQAYGMENDSTNEVTNNATSLLSYILYTDISSSRSEDDNSLTNWNIYTSPYSSLKETLKNYNTGKYNLNAYADIIHFFGVDTFIKATKLDKRQYSVSSWYEALCNATNYDMTYYFETVLGLTIDEEVKSKYHNGTLPVFVPVACLYQTGRVYQEDNKKQVIETVRPFLIERKSEYILDFEKYICLPDEFDYRIKEVSQPKNGTIGKINEKKYKYNNTNYDNYSGTFTITLELIHSSIKTNDITFTINLGYKNSAAKRIMYSYDSTIYNDVDSALNNDFKGYNSKEEKYLNSTFMNGISANKIGYLEGKILIPQDGTYTFCLRAGRGKQGLYFSYDDLNYQKVISFDETKNTFDFDSSHCYKISLKKNQIIYYKQICISNNHPDAYTELGWSIDDTTMKTIDKDYIYNSSAIIKDYTFNSSIVYPYTYIDNYNFYQTKPENQKIIAVNFPSWSENEKIENLIDGNELTYYHSNKNNFVSEDNPFEITLDLNKTKVWNNIKFYGRDGINHLPKDFKLYGSIDNHNYELVADIKNATTTKKELEVSFDKKEFRYVKIIVTDTNSSNNKYICLSKIDFSYQEKCTNISCNELTYYNSWEIQNDKLASFGHFVSGNGTITYNVKEKISSFVLLGYALEDSTLKISIDNKSYSVDLKANGSLIKLYEEIFLTNLENTIIKIEVISGSIAVDSAYVGNL